MQSEITRKPIRILPGLVLVGLVFFLRFVLGFINGEWMQYAVMGSLGVSVLVLLWWAFFSRVPHMERWLGLLLAIGSIFLTYFLVDPSIAGSMMGGMIVFYSLPLLGLAMVIWVITFSKANAPIRWTGLILLLMGSSLVWTLFKSGGFNSELDHDFSWRWAKTAEDLLVAEVEILDQPVQASVEGPILWPEFRGENRDGKLAGTNLSTNWDQNPPTEIWRQKIGPGWSSFAVVGTSVFTQEQRGEEELVSCYDLETGEPIWQHADQTRFWESIGGAGPRSTPTIADRIIYAMGGNGFLNALHLNGDRIWVTDVAKALKAEIPGWGCSSSPLIMDETVIVAVGGQLAGFDKTSGNILWSLEDAGASYSSAHFANIQGTEQALFATSSGLVSVLPDGTVLWNHEWSSSCRIVQPAIAQNGDLILSEGETKGIRRLTVQNDGENWSTNEVWTTNRFKPYFSDFALHKGYAYGFDGRILACMDLKTGERVWKGGRYGNGQMILLSDQDLLFVLSEKGEMALVDAKPDGFQERSKIPAIKGKTWNHPVLIGDVALVRNAQEMAAFRLPTQANSSSTPAH